MKLAKRIPLFVLTNVLIIITVSVALLFIRIKSFVTVEVINFETIMYCLLWGFGGALMSLLLFRKIAKVIMRVKIISPDTRDPAFRQLVVIVHVLASRAGIERMPEVGYYESQEITAFTASPSKNRSLVAVSKGLIERLNDGEAKNVLTHEVGHIARSDMITMSLVQGLVNTAMLLLTRLAS